VRIATAGGRALQIRYMDPDTGKEVRIGTRTHDMEAAKEIKKDIEAKLRLGMDAKPKRKNCGPRMPWDEFREELSRLKSYRTESAREGMEYRLDIIESVIKPRTLGELANPAKLTELQARLVAGEPLREMDGKMQLRPRSRHSVKSYMRHLIAALNWANTMDWLPARIRFKVLDVDKKTNKGRSLTTEEFERMLTACESICEHDAESWKRLLRGIQSFRLCLKTPRRSSAPATTRIPTSPSFRS